MSDRPSVMIVDDLPANLRLMARMLRNEAYQVRPFPSGHLALASARQDPPDLIVLDISMPEMDGYEVCRQLKAHEDLMEIPIIFLSALDDNTDCDLGHSHPYKNWQSVKIPISITAPHRAGI